MKAYKAVHYQANRDAIAGQRRAYYYANREAIAGYRQANREARDEYMRAYRAANHEALLEKKRAYDAANAEAIAERKRAYRHANREAIAAQERAYYVANPHLSWAKAYRRRVRQFGFEPVVETFTRDELIARYGDACFHCGGPFEELDHWPIPVRVGGPHALDNCVPACSPCNRGWNKAGAA